MVELVGYARVSTREGQQVLDRQLDALNAAGCQRIFDDRGSGASTDQNLRPMSPHQDRIDWSSRKVGRRLRAVRRSTMLHS